MAEELFLRIRVEPVASPPPQRRVAEEVDAADQPITLATFQAMYRRVRRWFFVEFLKGVLNYFVALALVSLSLSLLIDRTTRAQSKMFLLAL